MNCWAKFRVEQAVYRRADRLITLSNTFKDFLVRVRYPVTAFLRAGEEKAPQLPSPFPSSTSAWIQMTYPPPNLVLPLPILPLTMALKLMLCLLS